MHALAAATLAGLIALILTPLAHRLAPRLGLIDLPLPRRLNKVAVPNAGGIVVYLAFWSAVAATGAALDTPALRALWLGSTVVLIVGLVDDRFGLHWLPKLGGQITAGALFVAAGEQIGFVTNPLGGLIFLGWWGVPLTLLWLVAVTNLLNFIDGLDGLAAGVSGIAAVPVAYIAAQQGYPLLALAAFTLCGAIAGFLPYNLNPARVFLGDAGAMFLGFILAGLSVSGAFKGATLIALAVPVLALSVPLFNGFFTLSRRLWAGASLVQADRRHVHDRLLELGLTQRQAVALLYAVSLGACSLALLLDRVDPRIWLPLLSLLAPVLVAVVIRWSRRSPRRGLDR